MPYVLNLPCSKCENCDRVNPEMQPWLAEWLPIFWAFGIDDVLTNFRYLLKHNAISFSLKALLDRSCTISLGYWLTTFIPSYLWTYPKSTNATYTYQRRLCRSSSPAGITGRKKSWSNGCTLLTDCQWRVSCILISHTLDLGIGAGAGPFPA